MAAEGNNGISYQYIFRSGASLCNLRIKALGPPPVSVHADFFFTPVRVCSADSDGIRRPTVMSLSCSAALLTTAIQYFDGIRHQTRLGLIPTAISPDSSLIVH